MMVILLFIVRAMFLRAKSVSFGKGSFFLLLNFKSRMTLLLTFVVRI